MGVGKGERGGTMLNGTMLNGRHKILPWFTIQGMRPDIPRFVSNSHLFVVLFIAVVLVVVLVVAAADANHQHRAQARVGVNRSRQRGEVRVFNLGHGGHLTRD